MNPNLMKHNRSSVMHERAGPYQFQAGELQFSFLPVFREYIRFATAIVTTVVAACCVMSDHVGVRV
jgi:hypothetical protein